MVDSSDLLKAFLDKIVIGVLVTAATTYLFFGYGAYSKAFENIETKTQGTLKLALALRQNVLTKVGEFNTEIRGSLYNADAPDEKKLHKLIGIAYDIRSDAALLSSKLTKSSPVATQISTEMLQVADLYKRQQLNVETFQKKYMISLIGLQRDFMEKFDAQIGDVASGEFGQLFAAFYKKMPSEYQPENVLIGALVVFLVANSMAGGLVVVEE